MLSLAALVFRLHIWNEPATISQSKTIRYVGLCCFYFAVCFKINKLWVLVSKPNLLSYAALHGLKIVVSNTLHHIHVGQIGGWYSFLTGYCVALSCSSGFQETLFYLEGKCWVPTKYLLRFSAVISRACAWWVVLLKRCIPHIIFLYSQSLEIPCDGACYSLQGTSFTHSLFIQSTKYTDFFSCLLCACLLIWFCKGESKMKIAVECLCYLLSVCFRCSDW